MNAAELGLAVSVFLACAVESVEALTIVMAVGITRSWPSAMAGVGLAVLALGGIIAALGTALAALPVAELRIAVGALLLVFGLQWLRKAVMRAAGVKKLRDEREAYGLQTAEARAAAGALGAFDLYSFAIAFKGVLLEGLEVALIVVGLGANQHRVPLAAGAAALAVAVVIAAGFAARAPLARVPENTMKFAVGVMLSSYGIFWLGEGVGVSWPGEDAFLLVIIPLLLASALLAVRATRRRAAARSG